MCWLSYCGNEIVQALPFLQSSLLLMAHAETLKKKRKKKKRIFSFFFQSKLCASCPRWFQHDLIALDCYNGNTQMSDVWKDCNIM